MPNVNLTDSRSRDAVVKAETTGVAEEIRYVDDDGQSAYTRKILKATVEHDYDTLLEKYDGESEALVKALIESDPEVDMEICGLYLWGVSKVYVNSSDGIVYRIEQSEIVRGPDGSVKDRRPRQRAEANVDMEIPLTWTGRKIDKADAVRRFVFASKLQIVHINGLTYDFLYGMAKELAEADALMMIGGGSKGRDPLIFRSGSIPYRGFLEGRIDGDKYILLLHLSNLELKVPSESKKEAESESKKEKEGSDQPEKSKKEKSTKVVAKTVEETPKKKTAKKAEESEEEAPVEKPEPEIAEKKSKKKKTDDVVEASDKVTPEPVDAKKKKAAPKAPAAAKEPGAKPSDEAGNVSNDDLGVWLKSVRMGKYLQLFIENEIDVDVLTELTDADLKELEIPLGSRRRLLKAVAETDDLRAEVVMAVNAMSGTRQGATGKSAKQKK